MSSKIGGNGLSRVNVFLTVDTEHSIGGAFRNQNLKPVGNEKRIMGRFKGRAWGIPLLMKIADGFGLPLTFFVEVLNHHFFGRKESEEVCGKIIRNGHDVQLHLHPNYRNFLLKRPQELRFPDWMSAYDGEEQERMLAEGVGLLSEYGCKKPVAFRAGCFAADEETLKALYRQGFFIDSSYNAAFLNDSCHLPDRKINDAARWHGIVELPITNFREVAHVRPSCLKPLDINGASFKEIEAALRFASARKMNCVTVLLHSFSFIKAYDVQYSRIRIRRSVIRRFRNLCRFLKENSSVFKVRTMGELTEADIKEMLEEPVNEFAEVPALVSVRRLGEQLFDRL